MSTVQPPDSEITARLQQFEPGTILDLFQLDVGAILSGAPVVYFTPSVNEAGHFVRYDGNVYVPVPMEAEGYDSDTRGAIPQPLIRVSNVHPILQSLLDSTGHLRGAEVTRLVVAADWLDDGDDPQPTWYMRRDVHRVEQLASSNRNWLEFRLAAALDVGDEQLPRRQVARSWCLWAYRTWDGAAFDYSTASCPYVGTAYFKADDTVTLNPDEDACSKKLTGCRLRFAGSPLPFGGFPGAGTRR